MPRGVAPEVKLRIPAPRGERLDQFRYDERLEHGAAQRMSLQRLRIFNAQRIAHHSGVEKVKPRALAQALPVVCVMGRQSGRDVADLESGQPSARGLLRDARIAGQTAQVEFGGRAGGG